MKIKFVDVGRSKATWAAECPQKTFDNDLLFYEWLVKEAKRHGVMSNNLDYMLNDGYTAGKIFAGFRIIGEFEIMEEAK